MGPVTSDFRSSVEFSNTSHTGVLIFFQKRKAGSMKYVFLLGAMMAQDETSGETLISGK
jgi:hypothetical protein